MAELFGKKTGCCRGQGGSMHMFRWAAFLLAVQFVCVPGVTALVPPYPCLTKTPVLCLLLPYSAKHRVLGGYAFIGEGIPIGLGSALQAKYSKDVLGQEGVRGR